MRRFGNVSTPLPKHLKFPSFPKFPTKAARNKTAAIKNKIKNQNFVGFQKRNGATEVTRTPDLLITNQLLYRLSHGSTIGARV